MPDPLTKGQLAAMLGLKYTGREASDFQVGDEILVYYGIPVRAVEATVVEVEPEGRYGKQRGWLLTRQPLHDDDPNDGETVDVVAAAEYCELRHG